MPLDLLMATLIVVVVLVLGLERWMNRRRNQDEG